ncbi:uncharacterized protein BDW47DRAFT_108710 [Aspergillus candidus]|uniref:CFEM domain-containing protein n=1 Tax=Aspergillus candidus TaxID=41067 RepID=A0A2I2F774_ASPCN|nr:hypothetical protein BDW47DRAFT_108710 [Aspergillus candidus]PLB36483.1 hypothetical protein BDW47DRAFT_108710 [Aspergillus candidus]
MKLSILSLPLVTLVATVLAQKPSKCVETCSSNAGPCDFKALDIDCMCSNAGFQAQVRDCINRDCPDQLKDAEGLQHSVCN